MATPIWKDTYYTTTADTLEFTVQDTSGLIFRGQSQKPSSQSSIKIRVNNICRPYLDPVFTDGETMTRLNGTHTAPSRGTFYLYTGTTRQQSYDFVWCEDRGVTSLATGDSLNNHINTKRAGNQFNITSTLTSSGSSNVFSRAADPDGCGDWAIYYLNRRGGWDSFLIEGRVTRSKELTTVETGLDYDNNTLGNSGYRHLEDTDTWVLNTGYLTDTESRILADNLLTTPLAYLHDLRRDEVTPVTVTDNQSDVKTYTRGNLNAYAINVRRAGRTLPQS